MLAERLISSALHPTDSTEVSYGTKHRQSNPSSKQESVELDIPVYRIYIMLHIISLSLPITAPVYVVNLWAPQSEESTKT